MYFFNLKIQLIGCFQSPPSDLQSGGITPSRPPHPVPTPFSFQLAFWQWNSNNQVCCVIEECKALWIILVIMFFVISYHTVFRVSCLQPGFAWLASLTKPPSDAASHNASLSFVLLSCDRKVLPSDEWTQNVCRAPMQQRTSVSETTKFINSRKASSPTGRRTSWKRRMLQTSVFAGIISVACYRLKLTLC